MDTYFHITSGTDYPAIPADEWASEFRRRFPCGHRPDERPLDVVVKDIGGNIAFNVVALASTAMIRSDLLDLLGDNAKWLLLGNVFDMHGVQLSDVHTLGSDYTLRLRGGPKSTRQFCKQCGQFLYFPIGTWYVLKSDLRDRPLYYSKGLMSGCLVRGDVYDKLKPLRFRKLYIAKVDVRDEPEDGLPRDLMKVTPETLVPIRLGSDRE
jgi:hypothetical protein